MATYEEIIHLGNDNAIIRNLTLNGSAADLSTVTRMTVKFGSTVIDSDTTGSGTGEEFDWSQGSGVLVLDFGGLSIPVGIYDAELVVYDSVNTDGIVWDVFKTDVR